MLAFGYRLLQAFCALSVCLTKPAAASPSNDPIIHQDSVAHALSQQSAETRGDDAKPFYMIAHRVLSTGGIRDALENGANAIEIDAFATIDGWFADHDQSTEGRGDTMQDMFDTIVAERKSGKTLTFVWLDLKNPDGCTLANQTWHYCSIAGLQEMARATVQTVGVRVVYGFYLEFRLKKAWKHIRDGLNSLESVNLDGSALQVIDWFNDAPYAKAKRIYSFGDDDVKQRFGDCTEKPGFSNETCAELRKAVRSNDFGKVFGWNVVKGNAFYVDKMLGTASVDGLLYGFDLHDHKDRADTRETANDIRSWVKKHPEKYYLARQNDWEVGVI